MRKLSIGIRKQDHCQGNLDAPCILVEYGDYQCPSCGDVQPAIRSLQARFGDQLSFVFRNFPLRKIHPWAEPAAELAEYAGSQGRFWEMHDLLYANQTRLNQSTLDALLRSLNLAEADMEWARSQRAARERVDADFAGGVKSSVIGTPTFFLNGDSYDGPTDYESLVALIEQVLISNGD